MVLFIGTLVTGTIGLGTADRMHALRDTHVVTSAISNLRQCRTEAITRNAPITWWIENGYFVWWHDANENKIRDVGEVSSALLDEEVTYFTYPTRGTFDGRGTHSTNLNSFPGMMVWIYFETRTEVITVSVNGDARPMYTSL